LREYNLGSKQWDMMSDLLSKNRLVGTAVLITAGALLLLWLKPEVPPPEVRTYELRLPGQTEQLVPSAAAPMLAPQSGVVIRGEEPEASASPAVTDSDIERGVVAPPAIPQQLAESVVVAQAPAPEPPVVAEPVPLSGSPVAVAAQPQPEPEPTLAPADGWIVQVAAFSTRTRAEALQKKLQPTTNQAYVEQVRLDDKQLYRVRIGPFDSKTEAEAVSSRVSAELELKTRVYKQQRLPSTLSP